MNFYANPYTVTLFGLAIIAIGFFFYFSGLPSPSVANVPSATTTTPIPALATTTATGTPTTIPNTTTAETVIATTTTATTISSDTRVTSANLIAGMHLTFEDTFNTFTRYLDAKGNITCNPGGTGTWQTVYHFCSRTIPSNAEAEIYIDQNFIDYLHQSTHSSTSISNPISVNNGILTIEAKPADPLITKAAGAWAKYTSGLITTQFSFSQQYGYFEMLAKMPVGEGTWPAFWLLPIDKSWPPEIDVMEAFGAKNDKDEGGVTAIHYASHTIQKGGLCGAWHDTGVDITSGYHTYGVNWQKDSITYFFDGVAYASCPGNPDANQPFYLLVNLAVGSTGSWPGSPAATATWPTHLDVDYVRAYQTN